MISAVFFDFSGTLFDDTEVLIPSRLAHRSAAYGRTLSPAESEYLCRVILDAVDSPEGRAAREGADRSGDIHRDIWTALAADAPGSDRTIARAFYDCVTAPEHWRPYPDVTGVLTTLRRCGVRIAVISNCGWDIRHSFRLAGLDELIDAFVLSFELGVEKPDPELFYQACSRLQVSPGESLMVGDDPLRDGAAVAAGIPVYLLPKRRGPHRERGLMNIFSTECIFGGKPGDEQRARAPEDSATEGSS